MVRAADAVLRLLEATEAVHARSTVLRDLMIASTSTQTLGPDDIRVTVQIGELAVDLPPDALSYEDPAATVFAMMTALRQEVVAGYEECSMLASRLPAASAGGGGEA